MSEILDALENAAKIEEVVARNELRYLREGIEASGGVWVEPPASECVNAKLLRDAARVIEAQAKQIAQMRACLDEELSNADHIVSFYHRNGPQWTGKDGHEYEDTSAVVGRAEETAQKIRAALQHSPDGMGAA